MSATQQLEIDGIQHPEPKENGSLALMRIVEKLALDPAADANKLAVLLDVKLKWEADEARKAFELAFQQFKRNLPVILKGKHVTFPTKSGGETDYWHAELDKAAPIIQESLLSYGIDQSWETGDIGGRTTVTCVLKGFGHTERASTLSGPPDTSGGKNSIQAIGSTTTYLQRYTLFASCGIVPKGSDDDGKTEGMPEQAIVEYCQAIKDAHSLDEAKKHFSSGWEKSKKVNDNAAGGRLMRVWEEKKKEVAKAGQR